MKKRVLIIKDSNSDQCTVSSYISKKLEDLKINNEIITIDKMAKEIESENEIEVKLNNYSNIVVVPQITKLDDSYLIDTFEAMGLRQPSNKNSIPVSAVVSYSKKNEVEISKILANYKELARKLKFKWQKGIGIDMGRAWIYRDLTTVGKVYDPILIELDFLVMDIKNNRTNHDFTFAKPKVTKGIVEKYYRLNDYMERVKNKFSKKQEEVV